MNAAHSVQEQYLCILFKESFLKDFFLLFLMQCNALDLHNYT